MKSSDVPFLRESDPDALAERMRAQQDAHDAVTRVDTSSLGSVNDWPTADDVSDIMGRIVDALDDERLDVTASGIGSEFLLIVKRSSP